MSSSDFLSKTSTLLAIAAGVLLIGMGGYYSYEKGILASTTDTSRTEKTISIAFNNFPEGDIQTQAKYSAIIASLTPNKPGYRCSQKNLKLNIPKENANKTDQEIIRLYRNDIFNQVGSLNSLNKNGIVFATASEFKSLVDQCYKKIKNQEQFSANDECHNIAKIVIRESIKDKCIGLGE